MLLEGGRRDANGSRRGPGCNGWARSDLEALLELVHAGKIAPVKHSVRPLSELPHSLQELIDRKVVGKALLIPA